MVGAKKPTVRSLSEEVDKLKEQMKDYISLKKKVSQLQTKLYSLESAKNFEKEVNVLNPLKCKTCEKTFD